MNKDIIPINSTKDFEKMRYTLCDVAIGQMLDSKIEKMDKKNTSSESPFCIIYFFLFN